MGINITAICSSGNWIVLLWRRMKELGPDGFYTLNSFPLPSSKETEETKQKFQIKHYLAAI